jgi:MYXO-CTERM domain-containing protein
MSMIKQLPMRIPIFAGVALAGLALGSAFAPAHAGSITYFATSPNSMNEVVSANAVFTTSANTLKITLSDTLANPHDVAQLLSDLSFTVGNGGSLTGATLSNSSGQENSIASGGTFTLGSTVATGWVPSLSGTSGSLDVLSGGGAGPKHLIIGPPGTGGTYSNANPSIAGNGPHNPFLNQSATFTITGSGITATTTITSATFSFGTTTGITSPGFVPEPSSLVLSASGFGLLGVVGVWRSRRRRQTAVA